MALTKDQKNSVVSEVKALLDASKITVLATYPGTSVTAMQTLRSQAKESETTIKIFKNRLVLQAIKQDDRFKDVDTSVLKGQLLYAFNATDEVAPAQVLSKFSTANHTLDFVCAITDEGVFISAPDVKALANLPTRDQLRGQLVATIAAPLTGFVSVLSGNLRGVLYSLNARAQQLQAE